MPWHVPCSFFQAAVELSASQVGVQAASTLSPPWQVDLQAGHVCGCCGLWMWWCRVLAPRWRGGSRRDFVCCGSQVTGQAAFTHGSALPGVLLEWSRC